MKQKNRMKQCVLGLVGLLSMAAVMAAPYQDINAPMNGQTGFFAQTGLGVPLYSMSDVYIDGVKVAGGSTSKGVAWQVSGGYMPWRYVGVEAGFMQNRATGITTDNGNKLSDNTAYAALRGDLPIGKRLDVFGKLGAGYHFMSGEGSSDVEGEWEPFAGVGASVAINASWAATVQYQGTIMPFFTNVTDTQVTGGVTYHF